MIASISLRRWTVRAMGLLLLVSSMVLGGAALAQTAPSVKLPKMTYTKNSTFHLPVQMDERTRVNLREVCLYVKSGSADWVRQETGPPTMSHFSYKVPRDGEYWFSLVTIDKAGRMTPADVSQEAPGLRVTVDSQPPSIDVQPWTSPEGDFCLRCQVVDANPDPLSVKATYRDQAGEHVLDPVAGNPALFKIIGRELLNQPLRISAADLCGNTASREVNVREMVVAALQSNKSAAARVAPVQVDPPPSSLPVDTGRTDAQKPIFPPATSAAAERTVTNYPVPANPPMVSQGSTNITLPPPPPNSVPSLPTPPQVPAPPKETSLPAFPREALAPALDREQPVRPASTGQKQILNTTHATIDYRIDQVGPSGVGKVEVYLTSDGGANWQRLQEDTDRRSPADIDLPGEGLFGIRLVVTNGNGFGGTPPARGDVPTCWIEVDTTVPFVQLRPIDPAQSGAMELRWTASDKNLSSEPVSLYYKLRAEGQWLVMARNIKNDGLYRWTFPRDQGSQFFVKVEVVDMAGNTARAETANPIILDMTEPHASVVGISGVGPRTTPPVGH